jgi:glycosyltransferase involved in cell wall biosynthesis
LVDVTILSNFSSEASSEFLLSRPCAVAVIPSIAENLPYTVMESLILGIPFIASRVGGIPELIHPEDVEFATFQPTTVFALTAKLKSLFNKGIHQVRPILPPVYNEVSNMPSQVRPNPAFNSVDEIWKTWHSQLVPPIPLPLLRQGDVRVSVVIATFNPVPSVLEEAITSLYAQDYPASLFEVVLVNDGSTDTQSLSSIAGLSQQFEARGWRILHIENSYLGAARSVGVMNTTGDAIMFMDDDNVAKPGELSTFVNVWRHGGDVFTCLIDEFKTKVPEDGHAQIRYLPSGNTDMSWQRNTLGDANFFISRDAWNIAGPFSEDRLAYEDWELLHKAHILNLSVSTVVDALFWKRTKLTSMLKTANHHASTIRAFRPSFLSKLPELRAAFLYAKALAMKADMAGIVVMDTSNDFMNVQGYADLFYCFRPALEPSSAWKLLPTVSVPRWAQDENDFWYSITDNSPLGISTTTLHPSVSHDAAKLWRSRVEGVILIEGEVLKVDTGGDGVDFSILVNSQKYFQRSFTDRDAVNIKKYARVKIGDNVTFVAHSRQSDAYDSMWCTFTISFDRKLKVIPVS